METKLVNQQKTIALVAHDNLKSELMNWISLNIDHLKKHKLCGTGTTSSLIRDKFKIEIESFMSGPMGGDQQLGAEIAKGNIDLLIFFWDPLEAQPHDPDVRALLRIAVLYNIPVAQSVSGANYLISSPLFNQSYAKEIPSTTESLKNRVRFFSKKES